MSSEHPDELGNPAPGPGLPDHGSAPRLIPVRPRVRLGRWLHRGPQVHAGPQADAGPQVDATAGPVAVSHRAVALGVGGGAAAV